MDVEELQAAPIQAAQVHVPLSPSTGSSFPRMNVEDNQEVEAIPDSQTGDAFNLSLAEGRDRLDPLYFLNS